MNPNLNLPDNRPASTRQLLLLLIFSAFFFFLGLGRFPLLEPDEGRNAEVAREMIALRDFITPHFNHLVYLDKPALYFWMVAGSFKVFGLNEWAARFPSALMALGTILLVWLMGRRMFDGRTGFMGACVAASAPLVIAFSRTVIFDMTLTFLVTLSMFLLWLADNDGVRRHRFDYLAFAVMGLAAITKGPVGFLLPLLSILVYALLRGRWRELRRIRWGICWLILLAVSLPWFLAVCVRHPDFPRYAFWEESLVRFATPALHRSGGALYYLPVYLAGFFPWSIFLLFVGLNRLRHWKNLRQDAQKSRLFLIAWFGVIFVFFSISHSKLPGYLLPAAAPMGLLMAGVWNKARDASVDRAPDWLSGGFAAMILLGVLVDLSPQLLRFHRLATRLSHKIPPQVYAFLKPSVILSGMILFAIGFLGRNLSGRLRGERRAQLTFALLVATTPLLLVRWIRPLHLYFQASSSRQLARKILSSPQRNFPVYGYFYFRTGLPFYLRRPVGLVTADGDEMTSNYVMSRLKLMREQEMRFPASQSLTQQNPAGRAPENPAESSKEPVLLTPRQLHRLGVSPPGPFLLLVRNNEVGQLNQVVNGIDPLWTGWDFSVWAKLAERR
ncbi:MAG TPA: glycosyltransferase family 39 protein [Terriglobia bacterium]|nr:glycosyltransferase family 39 protein [Terriglobia bacterium]